MNCKTCKHYEQLPASDEGQCYKAREADMLFWTPRGFVSRVPEIVNPEFGCIKHEAVTLY